MNIYRYVFPSVCPSDGDTIIYGLEIRSEERVMVESIKDACAEWPRGFQEDIAADLHKELGGVLTLRAQHQGVEIVTTLGDSAELEAMQLLKDLTRAIEFRSGCLASHADEEKQGFADERFWGAYDKAKAYIAAAPQKGDK